MSLLLIGSDARLSKRLLNIKYFKYKTSRRDSLNSNLYLDFINVENFKIPNDVSKCLIIGGPVSYGESRNDKKIVYNLIIAEPKTILNLELILSLILINFNKILI